MWMQDHCFRVFGSTITQALPDKFTFPYSYEPHCIAVAAVSDIQDLLEKTELWDHDFGIEEIKPHSLGKMFGVLVVKNKEGQLGYLAAYSGKINGSIPGNNFVPAIRDYTQDVHFVSESKKLEVLTAEIEAILKDEQYIELKRRLTEIESERDHRVANENKKLKKYKAERKQNRKDQSLILKADAYKKLLDRHTQESINDQFGYKELVVYLQDKVDRIKLQYDVYHNQVLQLKSLRQKTSFALQDWIFEQYAFLSYNGSTKNVKDLFKFVLPQMPPSGAGDCAAPKLLHYAFRCEYTPIALAEFWWGKSPNTTVRKHKYYYPACRGKCKPILDFMLDGMPMDPNPLLDIFAETKELDIIFEDKDVIVLHKPDGILSVPGKEVTDSVQERLIKMYPDATGPMIVHRLDMATSGLLVAAKTKEAHKHLQDQFKKKQVKKRYIAVLDGRIDGESGYINLPLRVDLDNRPSQLVCYDHGKVSRTKWEVVDRSPNRTTVHFYPITGRTHQLRVHAAHHMGLDTPIVGDMLYGKLARRLYLHAETLSFIHPAKGVEVSFQVDPDFPELG